MNATTTWHDPFVAEIHATREHLADQYRMLACSRAAEERCRALGLIMAEDQHFHAEYPNADKHVPELSAAQP